MSKLHALLIPMLLFVGCECRPSPVAHRLAPVVETVSTRATSQPKSPSTEELERRWEKVLSQGWEGPDADIDEEPAPLVLEDEAGDEALSDEEVLSDDEEAPLALEEGDTDDEEAAGIEDDEAEDDDEDELIEDEALFEEEAAEAEDDLELASLDAAQIEALQLQVDALSDQLATLQDRITTLEAENALLISASATHREQIAYLQLLSTVRAARGR
jgi:hypothetical protein